MEMGPIVAFFATYKSSNIFMATAVMVVVTLVCLAISYYLDRKVSIPLLLSGFILLVSGLITLYSGDPMYIKMKPTIVYLLFSGVLYFGMMKKRLFIKDVLGPALIMDDKYWTKLSYRFVWFFLVMAITNEFTWRLYSENFWVNFKVFGALPIAVIFTMAQIPFLKKHSAVKID